MLQRVSRVGLVFAVLLLTAMPATAQDAKDTDRDGLWGGFGLGVGSICGDCGDRITRPSGTGYLGGTVSPSLRLAGAVHVFTEEVPGGLFSFSARIHPSASDFFVLLGAGVAAFQVEIKFEDDAISATKTGGGGVIGLGYDIPLTQSGKIALTPYANWVVTTVGNDIEFLQFGLGLTWN